MKFIVDRKTWYRGQGSTASFLRRPDGLQCCIGFVGQQCGVPEEDLLGFKAVHSAVQQRDSLVKYPKWIGMGDTLSEDRPDRFPIPNADLIEAYKINDDPGLNDTDREARLIAIFKRNGDELEFIN